MGLILNKVSPRLPAGDPSNSLKSTGPKAELGKAHASRNPAKHFIFANVKPWTIKELGETPQFEELRESLQAALAPQDRLEETLIDDMVAICWRLRRLSCTEMALLAVQKKQYELRVRLSRGKLQEGHHNLVIDCLGLAAVSDSSEKSQQILWLLLSLSNSVEE